MSDDKKKAVEPVEKPVEKPIEKPAKRKIPEEKKVPVPQAAEIAAEEKVNKEVEKAEAKARETEEKYPAEDFVDNAMVLFGLSKMAVKAALQAAGLKEATKKQATDAVQALKKTKEE